MTKNLKNLKRLKSVDIDQFNGTKAKISSVELLDELEGDFGKGKQTVRQILIKSENLNSNDDNIITASEYVSLKYDKTNKVWGYSDSPKSKAMQILKFYNIDSFDKLINKEIIVLKKQKENGKEYLGIQF